MNIFFIIKKKKNERREAEIRMGKIKIIQTSVALSLVLNNVADVAVLAHVANETLESETDTPSVPSVPEMGTAGTGQESESTDEVQTPSAEGETVGNEESETPSIEGETLENEESEIPSSNQGVTDVEISEDEPANDLESSDEMVTDELELQGEELLPRASGSGLVQLWQVVPSGQTQEGKTTSEIMKNLQCRPNHNLYPLNGGSQHETYVNSCYVDDALYLGEDANYYYVYLSGYEGKVPKTQSHYFELDLNNDGQKVKYEIQTVAYYIPDSGARSLSDEGSYQEAPELKYHTDHLNKADELNESGIAPYAADSVQSPSYYANENGTLYHYLTNDVTKSGSYSKVTVGKAPSFMSQKVKYYSYDGIYFYTDWRQIDVDGVGAVNQDNPFYNYYQYLPFRSNTNYEANAFDTYTSNNGGSGGKLVGTGKYFDAVGDRFGINGALQYAMGIHESGWGKSSLSMNKNNLFGMNATDNNPYGNGTSFPSVEAGINYHADRYLSWGYTDPISDWRYFGSHVGNKGSGMNVKYASDPFWGEKIAGWYYRFDQANGSKDYNYYSLGIKSSNKVVDVKSDATSSAKTYYKTKNSKNNLSFGNYPVLITGEKNGYYRIQTDTPIINGSPVYNGTYDFKTSTGYISKNEINSVNHTNYKSPDGSTTVTYGNFLNHIDQVSIGNSGLYLYGWAFTEGVDISQDSYVTKELLLVDERGLEVVRQTAQNIYNADFAEVFKGPYQYARYKQTLNINSLTNGTYSLKIDFKANDYQKMGEIKSNDAIDTGYVQVGTKAYRVFNTGKGTALKLEVKNAELGNQQNHVDRAEFNQNGLYLYGWSFIENADMSQDSQVKKTLIIKDATNKEVKRQTLKNFYHKDFADAYNAPYQYARYEQTVDVYSLANGTYTFDIEVNVPGGTKTSQVTSNYSLESKTYQVGNKIYKVSNSGKGTALKLEVSDVKAGKQENHVDKAEFNQNGLYLYGWSFIENLNMNDGNQVKKTLIIKNSKNQEVKRQTLANYYHPWFSKEYNKPYDYARYEQTVDIYSLANGTYTFDIEVNVSGILKTSQMTSNFDLGTKTYQVGNKTYKISNSGKGTALKLEVSDVKAGKQENHVDKAEFNQNGLYLYGWSFIENLNMNDGNQVKKTLIIKNSKNQEVKRQTLANYYHPWFSKEYNKPYDYARYEQTVDIYSLANGTYTFDIEVNVSGISKTSQMTSNYNLGPKTYQVGNKIYKVSNSGKGTTLKLEVSDVKAGKQENHVDKAEFNQDGLYLYGWSFIENLDMNQDDQVKKTLIIKNSSNQEVKRQTLQNFYSTDLSEGYKQPYNYGRYEQTVDIYSLANGTYTFDIEVNVSGISKTSQVTSNFDLGTKTYQVGNKTYKISNAGKGKPVKLEIL